MSRWRSKRMCLIHFLVAKHHLEVIKVLSAQQAPESRGKVKLSAETSQGTAQTGPCPWYESLWPASCLCWGIFMQKRGLWPWWTQFIQHPALKTPFERSLNETSLTGSCAALNQFYKNTAQVYCWEIDWCFCIPLVSYSQLHYGPYAEPQCGENRLQNIYLSINVPAEAMATARHHKCI